MIYEIKCPNCNDTILVDTCDFEPEEEIVYITCNECDYDAVINIEYDEDDNIVNISVVED